ncbi:TPA: redoxin domain-containing protein [Candidatus Poribacteria bacterium]|nr:redoxin domain-containing protein [Candidatus Poribacteria bacterium]
MSSILLFMFTCVTSFSAPVQDQLKVGEAAPDFILRSVDGQEYSTKKLSGKIIVLIMGNRKIRKEDNEWGEIIQEDFERNDRVAAFIIGDMRSVPSFVPKSFLKKQLKKKPAPVTFLLDWVGKVHQQYKTQPKLPNLYVIGLTGRIIFRKNWKLNQNRYLELKSVIDKELLNLKRKDKNDKE